MIAAVRDLLKRKLSPEAFRYVCLCWWYGKFFLPRRIASIVVKRSPKVYGEPSDFVDRLRGINTFAPTTMCLIMTRYGSDKGNSWHNYTAVYSELFKTLRDRELRIFELGLGTNNPKLASTMGVDGRPGASLRGWREIFPKALVFGGDIDRDILFAEPRIQTFYCDQTDSTAISNLWAQPPLRDPMDIIIDDGLHRFLANASFLAGSLGHLRTGGIYVVEDIRGVELDHWREQLPIYAKDLPNYDVALLELPSAFNQYDNNMLIIQKKS
jgi:hypothetical protein